MLGENTFLALFLAGLGFLVVNTYCVGSVIEAYDDQHVFEGAEKTKAT
jgi:hypothetical protein